MNMVYDMKKVWFFFLEFLLGNSQEIEHAGL